MKIKFTNAQDDYERVLPDKGTYTLIIFVPCEKLIRIGKIGSYLFRDGYYAYTGSALGRGSLSLCGRISRHLRKDKKKRWHIDFLLSEEDVTTVAVVAAKTKTKMECELNLYIKEQMKADIPVINFGSSDCRRGCKSHLLFLGRNSDVIKRIAELYAVKTSERIIILGFDEQPNAMDRR